MPLPRRKAMDAAPRTVAQAFEMYLRAVFDQPERVQKVQRIELRRAFFAGHYACVTMIREIADDASAEEHEARVQEFLQEVEAFVDIVGTPAEELL